MTHFQNNLQKKTLSEFAKALEHYTSEGLRNLAAFELDICSRYWVMIMSYHVNFTHHRILTGCSLLIKVFIACLMYNNGVCL